MSVWGGEFLLAVYSCANVPVIYLICDILIYLLKKLWLENERVLSCLRDG